MSESEQNEASVTHSIQFVLAHSSLHSTRRSAAGVCLGWVTVIFAATLSKANPTGDMTKVVALLFTGRIFDGLTSIMAPVTSAAVIDISPPSRTATNLGMLQGFAIGFAFLFGAPIGGIISSRGEPLTAFKLASGVAAANFFWTRIFVTETLAPTLRTKDSFLSSISKNANPAKNLKFIMSSDRRKFLVLSLNLVWTALNMFQVTAFNYAKHVHGWEVSRTAMYQSASGVALATIPKLLIPILGERAAS